MRLSTALCALAVVLPVLAVPAPLSPSRVEFKSSSVETAHRANSLDRKRGFLMARTNGDDDVNDGTSQENNDQYQSPVIVDSRDWIIVLRNVDEYRLKIDGLFLPVETKRDLRRLRDAFWQAFVQIRDRKFWSAKVGDKFNDLEWSSPEEAELSTVLRANNFNKMSEQEKELLQSYITAIKDLWPRAGRQYEFNIVSTPRSVQTNDEHQLQSLRADAMKDEMVEVGLDDFIRYYLPFQPDTDTVKLAEDCLKQSNHLNDASLECEEFSSGFQSTNVANQPFQKLGPIFHILETLKLRQKGPTCKFGLKSRDTTTLETSASDSDGYLRLLSTTTQLASETKLTEWPTSDIAVNFGLKHSPEDRKQNRRHVLHTAGHVMDNDPRRRFMYSVTIEGGDTRLWYWSRSHSVMTGSFDFTKEPRRFIHIMLAFIFATPQELGYDNSIKRIRDANGKVQYVYRIGSRFFKTLCSVVEPADLRITGRTTRVWEAEEVGSFEGAILTDNPRVIVRDVWLDESSKTEKEIQNQLFATLQGLHENGLSTQVDTSLSGEDEEHRKELVECIANGKYKDYFLTIIVDEKGISTRGVPETANLRVGIDVFDDVENSGPSRAQATSLTTSHKQEWRPRVPYRLAYKEVCTSLNNVANFSEAVETLIDGVTALQLLFIAGWVHRDISSGNLLSYTESGPKCRLGDLEFMKEFQPDEQDGSDPKTGTPHFMALEIQSSKSIYRPEFQGVEDEDFDSENELDPKKQPKPEIIKHNFEHDLESIFWLLLWFLTSRSGHEKAQEYGREVFQHAMKPSNAREDVFTAPARALNAIRTALSNHPPGVMKGVILLRDKLLKGYHRRKENVGARATYSHLYKEARTYLELCKKRSSEVVVEALPQLQHRKEGSKRVSCQKRKAAAPSDTSFR
ncbi:hypothetical protein FRB99_006379 [Tulasnella sp. 403]|nr:hypothetical protein FRB99_006379 [Tulasnella sp. 403]